MWSWAFAILAIYLFHRIVHSPMGLAIQGIRDSETRTACVGISVRNYRLISFTIAGLYAGLAGALLPPLESTVTPPRGPLELFGRTCAGHSFRRYLYLLRSHCRDLCSFTS